MIAGAAGMGRKKGGGAEFGSAPPPGMGVMLMLMGDFWMGIC